MVWIARLRRIWRVSIRWWIVLWPLSVVDRWAHLPLPAFFLDGHLGIDAPIEAFTFFVSLYESIMLTEIVSDARLPATCSCLELVPWVFLLNVVVYLLKVHLTVTRGGYSLVDEHHVIGRRTLQLFFAVVLDTHLWRRCAWRFDRLLLLALVAHQRTIALLGRFQDVVTIPIARI